MSIAMTVEEREAFLADLHVGVLSVWDGSRGPLTLPIWYAYQPGGELTVITSEDSRKAKLIDAAGRFSLCAQTEQPPYKYVSVEGPVTSTRPADFDRDLRPMAHRYLGTELGDAYTAASPVEGQIVIAMKPARWLTVDYTKQYG
jgi:hypothetical protein